MKRFVFLLTPILMAACQSSKIISPTPTEPPEYSLVYVIHGDANYLYHNADGEPRQADEQVLKNARQVAREAQNGEVFIFHQNPERKILWLFPKKDRQFLYYRNGCLIHKERYSPQSQKEAFVKESGLYQQYSQRVNRDDAPKIFLYFGHEVPVRAGLGYHSSRPGAAFNTRVFANGLQSFIQPGGDPFDLTVLSTCNNGTPSMIQASTHYSRYVLASPQNLHLSHIDTDNLASLLEQPGANIPQIADSLAAQTYRRLSSFLQTVVTLSVYNTQQTKRYLPELAQKYEQRLDTLTDAALQDDNTDCADFSFFDMPENNNGITAWYKPPQFGVKGDTKTSYSGWGCK